MNIIELNKTEVSSVSGGGLVLTIFNAAGFIAGCIYAAYKLRCGSNILAYTPKLLLQQHSAIMAASTEKIIWIPTSLLTKTVVISGCMIGGNIIFGLVSKWLFGESK